MIRPITLPDHRLSQIAKNTNTLTLDQENLQDKIDTQQIDDSLEALFAGDQEALSEFVSLCIKDLDDFDVLYRASLDEGDLPKLREVSHKYKSAHKLLGLEAILQEVDQGKSLLNTGKDDPGQKQSSSQTMHHLCLIVKEHLSKKL